VKDQGACGSCWAFASVAALESVIKIATGTEYDLSEQQVISCMTPNSGCNGGYTPVTWAFAERDGVVEEVCVPYEGDDSVPCTEGGCLPVATCGGWIDLPNDMNVIKTAILSAPVTSSFTAYPDLIDYTSGCYEHPGDDWPNHVVLIAGWDDAACDGEGAWLVKNSSGEDWGDLGGCFWPKYGTCQIATDCKQVLYASGDHLVEASHLIEDAEGDGDAVVSLTARGGPFARCGLRPHRAGSVVLR